MPVRSHSLAVPILLRSILVAFLVLGGWIAVAAVAAAQSEPADDTDTSLVESDGQSPVGNILTRPNSGQAPDSPNDPGGWQQYLVFGLIFAGLAIIAALATRESRRARAAIAARKPTG